MSPKRIAKPFGIYIRSSDLELPGNGSRLKGHSSSSNGTTGVTNAATT
jgi:hypothetical protein